MSINIGGVELSSPVILAPMSGVTDLPFRKLVKKFGAGLVVSEMVASRAMILETRKSMLKSSIYTEDSSTACVQLAGCEPEVMAEAAKMIQDLGAKIIDINFGCPAKKVVGGYAGSYLMRDEILASKILEATVKAVNIPVTLKMRTGWDSTSKNAPRLSSIAEKCGIKMITVHGRTRCQFYSGNSDWEFIKEVKNSVSIPVIANGDIKCSSEALECLSISQADGVMVGRAAYGKPWLLSQIINDLLPKEQQKYIAPPTLLEQKKIVLEHYESMLEYYGLEAGMKIARKHLSWYSAGLPSSSEFRAAINTNSDVMKVKSMIRDFYNKTIELLEERRINHK